MDELEWNGIKFLSFYHMKMILKKIISFWQLKRNPNLTRTDRNSKPFISSEIYASFINAVEFGFNSTWIRREEKRWSKSKMQFDIFYCYALRKKKSSLIEFYEQYKLFSSLFREFYMHSTSAFNRMCMASKCIQFIWTMVCILVIFVMRTKEKFKSQVKKIYCTLNKSDSENKKHTHKHIAQIVIIEKENNKGFICFAQNWHN